MNHKIIGIVNYGSGNVYSVAKCLANLGCKVVLADAENELIDCDGLILPGVGAFGEAAIKLRQKNLDIVVKKFLDTGKPLLGICVGMQLLFDESHEFGNHKGLGLISGKVKRISFENSSINLKVPFVGWREVTLNGPSNVFTQENNESSIGSYYFVHSYSAQVDNKENLTATYKINELEITAVVEHHNLFGVQFHPERSGKSGQLLLKKIFFEHY